MDLKKPLEDEECEVLTASNLRKEYKKISQPYLKLLNKRVCLCANCDKWLRRDAFYNDKRFKSGFYPICSNCLLKMATDYDEKEDKYLDNKGKTIRVFSMLNLPFIDSMYERAKEIVYGDEYADSKKKTAYAQLLVTVKSLPQYNKLTFKDSNYVSDEATYDDYLKANAAVLKKGKKRFGQGYSDQDLIFLETEYEDWVKRYVCENKAQEILFQRICFKELDIDKAQKSGKDTKELDKTLQDLMGSLSVKPNQSSSNALTEAKTFGQLIDKWEEEQPVPEPEEVFKDVDRIGTLIDVFFKGHLSKMMGLKNAFSSLYEKFMDKYRVENPEYAEDEDTEHLFNQIFSEVTDDE